MIQLVSEKLSRLRASFSDCHIEGFIIPTSDPHLSEYTAAHWKFRKWISGFSGSAGTGKSVVMNAIIQRLGLGVSK